MTEKTKFPLMYCTFRVKEGRELLILVPEQGFEAKIIEFKSPHSFKDGEYYLCDLEKSEATLILIPGTAVTTKTPEKQDISASKQKVEKIFEEIKEQEKAIEKNKAKLFLTTNNIPDVPEELFIDKTAWEFVCASANLGKYSLLLGPKGCGKSQTAISLANVLGNAFYSFNMGAAFKPKQFFCGMLQAKDGNTELVESEFLKAYQCEEPTIILLDELTRLPQAASNYLMTILDRAQSYIYIEELGKRIYKGKGVRFVCTGNVGMQYTDTRTLDGAFWDRFIKITVDYLPENKEVELIQSKAPKAEAKHIKSLVAKANKCRIAEKEGTLTSGVSTRQLIDMAHYLESGFKLDDIIEIVFLNNFINGNNNEIEAVRLIIQS